MDFHPICLMLPEMSDEEYKALAASIRSRGLLRPITTYEGMILDGRHRYRACVACGIEPRFEAYTGDNPAEHVRALHTQRNLTPLQRARLALAIGNYEHEREAAKERQRAAGGDKTAVPANWREPPGTRGEAIARVAEKTGVPTRTLQRAAFIETHAIDAVKVSQALSVHEAAEIARLTPKQQGHVMRIADKDKRKEAVADARMRTGIAKARSNRGQVRLVGPAGDGSLGRKLLNQLDRCWMLARENGLKTPTDIAARIATDIDLSQPGNRAQIETARHIAEAILAVKVPNQAA